MKQVLQRIMIIDDDEVNNFLCTKVINRSGLECNVESYLSGMLALRKIIDTDKDLLPDLLFLDINMPVMNGWDFLEEFKKLDLENKENIKIIMLSSSIYQKDIEKAEEYEIVSDYVTKPLSIDKILEINRNLFEK